jgi:ABC-2 type transport system ATP-binding protein/lipopolysaccharide transport system ATP-binding protein
VASISLRDVFVHIPVYSATGRSLKRHFIRATTGAKVVSDSGRVVVKALTGVNLELQHGDRVGLVGHNGAGKTTLLRVLAGVYEPTLGSVSVEGKVIPLFDMGLGIDPDATGYDNVMVRGTLLGIPAGELPALAADVAAFTELGDYLDMPVRTYSHGMYLRLAFGISTGVAPDILLMDEFFAVGDAQFLAKAEQRLGDLIRRAGIMVLASHSDQLIRRFCNKAVWVNAGEVKAFGRAEEVLGAYSKGLT